MSDAHDDQSTTVPAEPVAPEVSVPPELVGPAVPSRSASRAGSPSPWW